MRAPFRRSAGRLPSSLEAGQLYARDLVATAGLLVTAGAPTVERRRLDARARPSARLSKIQRWRLCKTTGQSEGRRPIFGSERFCRHGTSGRSIATMRKRRRHRFLRLATATPAAISKATYQPTASASITCLDRSTTTSPKSPKPKAKDGSVQKRRP